MQLTIQAAATNDKSTMAQRFQVAFVERSAATFGATMTPGTLREAQDLACRMACDGEFTAALKCAEAWWDSRAV